MTNGDITEVVNLTPHDVDIVTADGDTISLAPGGPPARLLTDTEPGGLLPVQGRAVPTVLHRRSARLADLPDPVPGRVLVVSRVVAAAAAGRTDLVFPDEFLRDSAGNIVACQVLARFDAT